MNGFRHGYIYRLMEPHLWEAAKASGHLLYAPVDDADGFFHLSTDEQVFDTARLHYGQHETLVACGVDPATLGEDLKWEPSRGGQLFPHYYGYVPTEAVVQLVHLAQAKDGGFNVTGTEELI